MRQTPQLGFSIAELSTTSTGYPNAPDAAATLNLNRLNAVLIELKNRIGPFRIASAYRSPAVNQAVGGADGSLHQSGMAADIVPTTLGLNDFYAKIIQNPANRAMLGEIALKPDQGAIHVSLPTPSKHGVIMIVNEAGQYIRKSLDEALAYVGVSRETAGIAAAAFLGLGLIAFLYIRRRRQNVGT